MTPEDVMQYGRDAMWLALIIGSPLLLVALVVGLVVGMFQAATQINETTLSFIPKLLGLAATLVIAGPWMLRIMTEYTRRLIESVPSLLQ